MHLKRGSVTPPQPCLPPVDKQQVAAAKLYRRYSPVIHYRDKLKRTEMAISVFVLIEWCSIQSKNYLKNVKKQHTILTSQPWAILPNWEQVSHPLVVVCSSFIGLVYSHCVSLVRMNPAGHIFYIFCSPSLISNHSAGILEPNTGSPLKEHSPCLCQSLVLNQRGGNLGSFQTC